ncbi:MAG TPA: hypothetical protein VJN88_03360 [Ktedonobacterales bacterium]|nr:hypothetical protein [Ktedonobacterales bacterium]
MRHVLHIRAEASLHAIQATISHTRDKRLALVFPLGTATALAAANALDALHTFSRASTTDLAIIGGDEALRAAAVAAGFVVATSLDEWETGAMEAIRPAHRRKRADDSWEWPHLWIVGKDDETLDALDHDWDEEPPEYVVELLVSDGVYPGADADPQAVPPSEGEREDDDEQMRQAAELYEDDITAHIRRTGGQPSRPVSGPLPFPLDIGAPGRHGGSTTETL